MEHEARKNLKVLAWNTQGGGEKKIANLCDSMTEQPDVICVAEAGRWIEGDYEIDRGYDLSQEFGGKKYTGSWVAWAQKKNGGNLRCSMAVLGQEGLWEYGFFQSPKARPIPFAQGQGWRIFVGHMKAIEQVAGPQINNLTFDLANDTDGPWVLVGDMNYDLLKKSVASLDLFPDHDFETVTPGVATQQSGGQLDWGIGQDLGRWKAQIVRVYRPEGQGPSGTDSDHSAILYTLNCS